MEPEYDFSKYPSDSQIINIRFGSYAYPQQLFVMAYPAIGALTFNTNYDNKATFKSNPIWIFDENTA